MITTTTRTAAAAPESWWLRGLPAAELPCERRPEWAAFVEQVLAAVPSGPRADLTDRTEWPGTTGFARLLAPFAEAAGARLPSSTDPSIRSEFTDRLAAALGRTAARTLVLELNVARVEGRLSGDTPSARFRDFLAVTSRRHGLSALLTEYPVLARLLGRSCLSAAEALTELLGRFAADRADLVRALLAAQDPGPLVAVDTAVGDTHGGGRSVAILRFADGSRVVYKPRPLTVHRHLAELIDWYNPRSGSPALRLPALLAGDGYGWLEFVPAAPCTTEEQLDRFYRRQGALLALMHALDGTDLHLENLIAHGDEPVLVDAETLFHPPAPAETDPDPALLALAASVHRIGLLPYLLIGDEAALDASGLGGDAGARSPFERLCWEASGTDEMHAVRRTGSTSGASNRPRLDGRDADPARYTESLAAGFRAGYQAVTDHRDDLTGPQGLLRRFADDAVRVVPRATQVYATLLDESTHPDLMRDAADRDEILGLLRTDQLGAGGRPGLVDHELAELWAGDVPLFSARPGSVDLWNGTGRRIPGALDRSGLSRACAKVGAMGPADRAAQEWIIRAAMAGRATGPAHGTGLVSPRGAGGPAPDQERLLAAARRIGDRLVELAHRSRRPRSPARANWLGLELLGDRYWRLRPLGADLGSGYTGTALFLARLARLTGADSYAEVARASLRPVPDLLSGFAENRADLGDLGSGGFAGLGGVLYGLTETAAALDDAEVRSWIDPATELAVAAAEAEHESGLLAGAAGGLAALLAVHRSTGSATAWRGAGLCAERLTREPLPGGPGFAAGPAGAGWALLRYAAAGGGAQYERAGLAALHSATTGRAATASATGFSWCEGLPGLALAVTDSPAALADPRLAAFAERAVGTVLRTGPLADHSLCHGELGVLDSLGDAAGTTERAGALLAVLEQEGPHCGTPGGLADPGLLYGLAGIGYGLLRIGFADQVPSVLRLDSGLRADRGTL
ncbi:type 2 lanthipeptide synthetase LanM family protein [Kitasatospora sp. MAP5-34]|uniref:type 2 lanthipeptide synthetase LanM family protein n=1 Tax=Kitasatospora sp. MAP5-34 TaxID=3035102 RepID=UPI002476744C|nr:type 2 lanthipeptide synthetase LanM family protein [Kitasatospora sp. MAP5-34]